jgi:hypothetical protein
MRMTSASVRFFLAAFSAAAALHPGAAAQTRLSGLSLEDCPRIAMEKKRLSPASRFAVAMAEAQHRQALAGYCPQISAKGGLTRFDEAPNFIFPTSMMYVPPRTVTVPGGTTSVAIPANAFGPGFPPAAVQIPVSFPGHSVSTTARIFPIPEQNIKVANPQNYEAIGNPTWLLYDGGMRQTAKAEARRLAWNATVRPSAQEMPYRPFAGNLNELVSTAYDFNPDWAKLEAGLRALEGAVTSVRSDYYSKLVFTGELHRWRNSYTAGMATTKNKGWSLGVGLEIPIFNGFLTKNKVAEAQARVGKLNVSVPAENGGCDRIDIEDNGTGITARDIPRLFSEFGQLGAIERSRMGCGLGLAICKRIAETQGGWVGVEGKLGKGSRFYAVLPRVLQTSVRSEEVGGPADPVAPLETPRPPVHAGSGWAVRAGEDHLSRCWQEQPEPKGLRSPVGADAIVTLLRDGCCATHSVDLFSDAPGSPRRLPGATTIDGNM